MIIACICTGNTCRSPMLAALLRQALLERGLTHCQVLSAGIQAQAGEPASPHARTCMRERGLNLDDHQATPLSDLPWADIDQVWCLSPSHYAALVERGIPAAKLRVCLAATGGVSDPYGGNLQEYRRTAASLVACVEDICSTINP